METARELDDVVMHQSTVIVDSYDGAQKESGDIILSKVSPKYLYLLPFSILIHNFACSHFACS